MTVLAVSEQEILAAQIERAALDVERGQGYSGGRAWAKTDRWKGGLLEDKVSEYLTSQGVAHTRGEPDIVVGSWECNVKHTPLQDYARVDRRHFESPQGNAFIFGRIDDGQALLYGWISVEAFLFEATLVPAGTSTPIHGPYINDGMELHSSALWPLENLR